MSILSKKQALKTITLISAAGKKLDERIHTVGVAGLHHFFESGDLDILTDLVHAMPRSGRGNALQFWITKHAPVKWDKKAYAGKGGYKKSGSIPENWGEVVQAANAEPFYTKTDTEQADFNADKYAASVVARLAKEGDAVSFEDFMSKLTTAAAKKGITAKAA